MNSIASLPVVSILVVNWNTQEFLKQCLKSIHDTKGSISVEVVVVDNASSDGSVEMVTKDFPDVKLLKNQANVGFARGNNQAAEMATGEYLLLLNSDAFLLPGTLEALLDFAKSHQQAAIIGARLINPDGSFQFSYADFPNLWREFLILSTLGRRLIRKHYPSHGPEDNRSPVQVDYVNGACLLVPRNIYQQTGGLPDQYFMYAEEVDFCLTIKQSAGQVWYCPTATVIHYGSGSSHSRQTQREGDMYQSRVRLMRKYQGWLAAEVLKLLIISMTVPKAILHGVLRRITNGKYGRPVISLGRLASLLREV